MGINGEEEGEDRRKSREQIKTMENSILECGGIGK